MRTNRIQHVIGFGLIVTAGLAAPSGAASAPATGSRLAAVSAQASAKIAFISTPRCCARGLGGGAIYVMTADGSGKRRLTRSTASDAHPAWSPARQKIAFTRGHFGDSAGEVHVMNADGSGQRKLTRNASFATPAWKIAFVRDHDGNSFPAWSPGLN